MGSGPHPVVQEAGSGRAAHARADKTERTPVGRLHVRPAGRRSALRYVDLRSEDGSVPDLAESALTENYRRLAKALQRGTTTPFIIPATFAAQVA